MPLRDVLIAALSRPAGRIVDGPVRDIVASALNERGYASPAEVAALKEEIASVRGKADGLAPRLDQLSSRLDAARAEADSLREALVKASAAASEAAARAALADAAANTLRDEVARLQSESESLRAALAVATAAPSTASSSSSSAPVARPAPCRVPACEHAAVANGFCREHQLRWRAGRLPGFVGPEGLVDLDGRPGRVSLDSAGLPYQLADGRLKVGGRFASVTPL